MADIILTTFNARYWHTSFGLRYLMANMGELKERSRILEYELKSSITEVYDNIIAEKPLIIGMGVYIWNLEQSTALARELKNKNPDLILIIGGPEVSFNTDGLEIVEIADYIIKGEADLSFGEKCSQLLNGGSAVKEDKPDLAKVELPYKLYNDEDLKHRVIYSEATRGCPFRCAYCLSALDQEVRHFELENLFHEWSILLERGLRSFKFVDRTFNLDLRISLPILDFFKREYREGLQLHFEMIPDRFPAELREAILALPPGSLHLELGVQTYSDEVSKRIKRKTDLSKIDNNITFLLKEAEAIVHVDLIAGLPGETIESFAAGFDRLVKLAPQEIQVGILKRLRGAPIDEFDSDWGMSYSPDPPYAIIKNNTLSATDIIDISVFARYWEIMWNRGEFLHSMPYLWINDGSPFTTFMKWTKWLYAKVQRTHSIPLDKLTEWFFEYLTEELAYKQKEIAEALWQDYSKSGKRRHPPIKIRPYISNF